MSRENIDNASFVIQHVKDSHDKEELNAIKTGLMALESQKESP